MIENLNSNQASGSMTWFVQLSSVLVFKSLFQDENQDSVIALLQTETERAKT